MVAITSCERRAVRVEEGTIPLSQQHPRSRVSFNESERSEFRGIALVVHEFAASSAITRMSFAGNRASGLTPGPHRFIVQAEQYNVHASKMPFMSTKFQGCHLTGATVPQPSPYIDVVTLRRRCQDMVSTIDQGYFFGPMGSSLSEWKPLFVRCPTRSAQCPYNSGASIDNRHLSCLGHRHFFPRTSR